MLRHKLKTHVTNVHPCEACCFLRNHLCSLAVAMQQFIHSACQQGTEGTMTHAVTLLATVMFNTWEGYSLACQEIWFPPVRNTRLSHFELRSNWLLLVLNLHLVGSILWRGQRTQQTLLSLGVCAPFFQSQSLLSTIVNLNSFFWWSLDFFNRISLCNVFFVLFSIQSNLFLFWNFNQSLLSRILSILRPNATNPFSRPSAPKSFVSFRWWQIFCMLGEINLGENDISKEWWSQNLRTSESFQNTFFGDSEWPLRLGNHRPPTTWISLFNTPNFLQESVTPTYMTLMIVVFGAPCLQINYSCCGSHFFMAVIGHHLLVVYFWRGLSRVEFQK